MKISQMSADQAADALVRISQPIANIADDPDIGLIAKDLTESKDLPPAKILATFLPRITALCLKAHRKDLYEVVGVLAEMPASKIGKLPVIQLMNIIRESVDQDLLDFFRSFGKQETLTAEEKSE